MKKVMKTAVLTMLLTMCFGFTAFAAESTNTSNTQAVQQLLNAQAAATSVPAATTSTGQEVTFTVQSVSPEVHNSASQAAASAIASTGYETVAGAAFVTVNVVPSAQPNGSVSVTLKNSNITAGKTYLVMHYNGSNWDSQIVTGGDGQFTATFASFSPVSFVEVQERSAASGSCSTSVNWEAGLQNKIAASPEGTIVKLGKKEAPQSLTLDVIKLLVRNNVTLDMEYSYGGVDYRIVIPGAKAAIDENVPIYGPLYLAAKYGSGAPAGADVYTVVNGDTLSKIARACKTTVEKLAALNPEIKDVNKIYSGQKIKIQ